MWYTYTKGYYSVINRSEVLIYATTWMNLENNNAICNCHQKIKHLEINLTKEGNNLYLENYKTLMKGIEDNTNKWKDILCSRIGKINTIKMFILPKVIDRSITIPIKIPMERDLCEMVEQKGLSLPPLMKTSESKLLSNQ